MPSQEAIEHYERALTMWNTASEEDQQQSDRLLRDVASEMVLAIRKAGEPYPKAHGKLGMFFLMSGNVGKAQEQFNTALQQDPYEINSRLGRVEIALENYRESSGLQSLSLGGIFGAIRSSAAAASSQQQLKQDITAAIEAYHRHLAQNTDDPEVWLTWSEMMIEFGDLIQELQFQMPGGRPNLYAEVLKAPWDRLRQIGHEKEVSDLLRKAEGRAALLSV